MTDEIDHSTALTQLETEGLIIAARLSADIPVGAPGVCRECGEASKRLVVGRCAPCRDGRDL